MTVPYIFAAQAGTLPLSQLDANFATTTTLGTTPFQLGDTVPTISGLSFSSPVIVGNILPTVTNTQTIGSVSLLWNNIYSTTFTGELAGNAATVTNGVYTNTAQTITGVKTFTGAIGVSATPSALWGAGFAAIELKTNNAIFEGSGGNLNVASNIYNDGTNNKYVTANFAAQINVSKSGQITLTTYPTGAADAVIPAPTGNVALDVAGNFVLTTPAGGIGYAAGAGGVVAQLTSRTTSVTLNKPTGRITLFGVAGTAAWQTFTVNNNVVTINDTIIASVSGTFANTYGVFVVSVSAGAFKLSVNSLVGVANEAPVINFAVIRGAAA